MRVELPVGQQPVEAEAVQAGLRVRCELLHGEHVDPVLPDQLDERPVSAAPASRLAVSSRIVGPVAAGCGAASARGATTPSSATAARVATAAGHQRRRATVRPRASTLHPATYGVKASACTSGPRSNPASRTAAQAAVGPTATQQSTVPIGARRRAGAGGVSTIMAVSLAVADTRNL